MPPKLALGLAAIFLLGALTLGNPFLAATARGARMLHDAPPVALQAGPPAPAPAAEVMATPARGLAVGTPQAADALLVSEPCPVPGLRSHVVGMRTDAQGIRFWLLEDGRRVRRRLHPQQGEGDYEILPAGVGEDHETR
jgi:hypothetical protein